MTGVIYKYTSPSGKCYIGQTVNETRRKYGWDSFEYEILNASEVTDTDSSGIIAVCRGKQKSAGGYQWRYGFSIESIPAVSYKEPVRIRKFGKDNPRSKTVYQYTLDYELVKIWESGCQAEREAGFDSTKISRVCNHKLPYYGKKNEDKYLWSFSELHDTETED